MAHITRDEVLRIAKLSHIAIHDDEIESIITHLTQVLEYAERVKQVAKEVEVQSMKNINVFRKDEVQICESEPILAQAPEREGNYFVVPRILEGGE